MTPLTADILAGLAAAAAMVTAASLLSQKAGLPPLVVPDNAIVLDFGQTIDSSQINGKSILAGPGEVSRRKSATVCDSPPRPPVYHREPPPPVYLPEDPIPHHYSTTALSAEFTAGSHTLDPAVGWSVYNAEAVLWRLDGGTIERLAPDGITINGRDYRCFDTHGRGGYFEADGVLWCDFASEEWISWITANAEGNRDPWDATIPRTISMPVVIHEPRPRDPDWNSDGIVNTLDFTAYLNAWTEATKEDGE